MADRGPADLFLRDSPPPARGRPRWLDGLGLIAVVLAMVAVGVLGDRGSNDRRPRPTTTTTMVPSTTTSLRLPPSTPPTTVRFDPLPTPTATRLLVLQSGSGPSVIVDVDAGMSVLVPVLNGEGGVGTTVGWLTVRNGMLTLVELGNDLRSIRTAGRALPAGGSQLTPVGHDGAWVTGSDGSAVVAVGVGADGAETGAPVRLPPQVAVAAGFDDGVVAEQAGSLTWVPVVGEPRPLGDGVVFGAGAHRIVRHHCVELRCRLDVVDVRTGTSRAVTGIPALQAGARLVGSNAAGDDGSWVATTGFQAATGDALLFTVDLRTGAGRVLNRGGSVLLATATVGPWVFVVEDVRHALVAYDRTTGETRQLRSLTELQVAGLVALPLPAHEAAAPR